MPIVRAESTINAPTSKVWDVLVNFKEYPQWNPFTVKVDTELELQAPVKMRVQMFSWWDLAQTEYITQFEEGRKICWGFDWGRFLEAERCQSLESTSEEQTQYVTEDRIEGKLAGLVMWLFGQAMQRGFEGVARTLKERVESSQDLRTDHVNYR